MPCLLLNALSLSLLFYLKPFRFSIPLSEETSKTNLSSLSLSLSLRKLLNLFRPHFNAEAFVLSRTWRHSGNYRQILLMQWQLLWLHEKIFTLLSKLQSQLFIKPWLVA
ncbi:hypothetical protein AAZV13_13G228450 [Glycine max]|uniref:Uncharacterized protein n=1 Tax=Glycine max TaxID=3847 RepID=K7M236_SOYBN|nr:hypothetical protein JHK85_038121 [Glycine max]